MDGLLALLDGADEELAAADLITDVAAHFLAAAGVGHEVLIKVADTQAGQLIVVEHDLIGSLVPLHLDVRGNVLLGGVGEGRGGPGIQGGDVLGGPCDFTYGYGKFARHLGEALPGEIFEVACNDAAFQAVLKALPPELDQQAVAEVLRTDACWVEGLDDPCGGPQFFEADAHLQAEISEGGLEKAALVQTADKHSSQFPHFFRAVSHAELLCQMVLQGHRGGEGIEHKLPLFLVLAGAWGPAGALLHIVAPFFIHRGEPAEFLVKSIIVEVFFGLSVLEGNFRRLHFEDRVLLHFQLQHLPQFKDRSLQYIQTLLQLWRQPLLLTQLLSQVRSHAHRPLVWPVCRGKASRYRAFLLRIYHR